MCIYGEEMMGCFWGLLSPPRHRRRKKGINFRVIKINLSFGELKIFQMVQKCNRIQSISYILIVWCMEM